MLALPDRLARVGLGILAGIVGAVAMFAVLGLIVVSVLFYGNRVGTVNLSDGPLASALLVAFLVSPLVGAAAGIWILHRLHHRRLRGRS